MICTTLHIQKCNNVTAYYIDIFSNRVNFPFFCCFFLLVITPELTYLLYIHVLCWNICYDIDDKWHNENIKMKDEVKWCTIKIN